MEPACERLTFGQIGFEHDLGAALEVKPQLQAHQVRAAAAENSERAIQSGWGSGSTM